MCLHIHKGAQGSNGRRGTPSNNLSQLLVGPSQGTSTYPRPICTSPAEHRVPKVWGNPNYRLREGDTLSQAPPRAVLADPQPCGPGVDTHPGKSTAAALWSILWTEQGYDTHCGHQIQVIATFGKEGLLPILCTCACMEI